MDKKIIEADVEGMSLIIRRQFDNALEKVKENYQKYFHALFLKVENKKRPKFLGTSFVMRVGTISYLVTAAHNIDESQNGELLLDWYGKLVTVSGEFFVTNSGKERSEDRYDFSFIELSNLNVNLPDELDEINSSDIETKLGDNLEAHCFVPVGFPRSKNKKAVDPTNGNKYSLKFMSYIGTLKSNTESFVNTETSPNNHYLLDYNHSHSVDSFGKVVNSISPVGLSGGGLFWCGKIISPDKMTDPSRIKAKLVGLLIERDVEESVLIAVKLSLIIDSIKLHQAK